MHLRWLSDCESLPSSSDGHGKHSQSSNLPRAGPTDSRRVQVLQTKVQPVAEHRTREGKEDVWEVRLESDGGDELHLSDGGRCSRSRFQQERRR